MQVYVIPKIKKNIPVSITFSIVQNKYWCCRIYFNRKMTTLPTSTELLLSLSLRRMPHLWGRQPDVRDCTTIQKKATTATNLLCWLILAPMSPETNWILFFFLQIRDLSLVRNPSSVSWKTANECTKRRFLRKPRQSISAVLDVIAPGALEEL